MQIFWRKPNSEKLLERARSMQDLAVTQRNVGSTRNWSLEMFRELPDTKVVEGDLWQFRRTPLGVGQSVYEAACAGVRLGQPFRLGWVRCLQPGPLEPGDGFCLLARAFGFYCASYCRVIYLEEQSDHQREVFSLGIGTLPVHAAIGEERMSVVWDRDTDQVDFLLGSFSKPADWFVWTLAWYLRNQQNRFAVDSAAALKQHVRSGSAAASPRTPREQPSPAAGS